MNTATVKIPCSTLATTVKTTAHNTFFNHYSVFQFFDSLCRSVSVNTSSAITKGSISRQYSPPMANWPRCAIATLYADGNIPQKTIISKIKKFCLFFIMVTSRSDFGFLYSPIYTAGGSTIRDTKPDGTKVPKPCCIYRAAKLCSCVEVYQPAKRLIFIFLSLRGKYSPRTSSGNPSISSIL